MSTLSTAGLSDLELAAVAASETAADAFLLQLFFISPACGGGPHLSESRRFHSASIHFSGHVVSGKTRAGRFGCDVCAAIE